jgi:hypothetical protein
MKLEYGIGGNNQLNERNWLVAGISESVWPAERKRKSGVAG